MSKQPTPRIHPMDVSWATEVIAYCEQGRREIVEKSQVEADKQTQIDYVMLANYRADLGCLQYALGAELDAVRVFLAEAAQAYLEVFRLRGTQAAFPVTEITQEPGQKWGALQQRPRHLPGKRDYSLTNSRTGLRAMYLALSTGEHPLAKQIAQLVWDPPNASYIGADSVVCTPDDQHLAYALKASLLGQDEIALAEIQRIADPPADLQRQAAMLGALVSSNRADLFTALSELLAWHQDQMRQAQNWKRIELFLSSPGLGLCAYALDKGLVVRDQLPQDNIYLPLDMLGVMRNE